MKIIKLIILCSMVLIFCASTVFALDLTADNCTTLEIESKAALIVDDGGGKLTLPICMGSAGQQTGIIDITINDANAYLTIEGQGPTSTILTGSNTYSKIFSVTGGGDPSSTGKFRLTNIGLTGRQSASATGVRATWLMWLQVDNCVFNASNWGTDNSGAITTKAVTKGLIHSNKFYCNNVNSNYYLSFGSAYTRKPTECVNNPASHTSCSDDTCDSYLTEEKGEGSCTAGTWCEDCHDTWSAWYDDGDTNNNYAWPHNWMPGTANAIFVEGNTFDVEGVIQGNWSSRAAVVFRYNDFKQNRSGSTSFSFKPGAHFVEVYNNNFTGINSRLGTERCDGVIYDNYLSMAITRSNYINAYFCGNDFCWPTDQLFTELYIWGNVAPNALCGDFNSTDCWREQEGDLERIAENSEYFFRAPTTEDRIYSGSPSRPVSQYTCPHPNSGLSGSCDNTRYGKSAYNVSRKTNNLIGPQLLLLLQ